MKRPWSWLAATISIAFALCLCGGCHTRGAEPKPATPTATPKVVLAPHRQQSDLLPAPSTLPPGAERPPERSSDGSSACPKPFERGSSAPAEPCGALDCRAFADPAAALKYVLDQQHPLVLGVGEAHVQRDVPLAVSPTRLFARLLPVLCGTSRDIVIELWLGRSDCGDRSVEQVAQAQKPITSAQAPTNQGDFVELGREAKRLGIEPHALRPSCDEYRSIVKAGASDVDQMLTLVAQHTAILAEQLLQRPEPADRPLVITFGGAMHNDVQPRPGQQAWTFGPELDKFTAHRYVELDLVVREQVRDTSAWEAQPFYHHFSKDLMPTRTLLYRQGPHSFTLVFPKAKDTP